MTSELDQSLPQERDNEGRKKKQPRNTSIGMLDYFSTIERLCDEKGINPDNLDQFFRVHWLRDAVGGSFKRAQEMFEKYIHYVETVPEEARTLAIPSGITKAVDDLLSLITWYYRMSYEDIQNDKVKELLARIESLQSDNEGYLARLQVNDSEIAQYKATVGTVTAQLETANQTLKEVNSDLEQTRLENVALGQLRDTAQGDAARLQLLCDNLTNQVAERRKEMSDQQEYLKQLVTESKKQQDEINTLTRERDVLTQTSSDLAEKLEQTTGALVTQKTEHDRDLNAALESCSESGKSVMELQGKLGSVTAELDITKGKFQEIISLNESLGLQLRDKSQQSAEQEEGMLKLKDELLQTKALLNAEKSISATMKETIAMLSGGSSPRTPKQIKSAKAVGKKVDKP